MSPIAASDSFLSWVRTGIATAIGGASAGSIPRRAAINVGVKVNTGFIPDVMLQLHGPGDVAGIDPRLVARVTPDNGSTDFEPNYFPAIEFTEPAFPWLFTPTGTADQRLVPWICLAVVRKQEDVFFEEPDPKQPLPVLVFKGAARPLDELPPLEEAWAWSHTHVLWARDSNAGADEDRLAAILRDTPELARSRLVCPRRLAPGAQYYACVVPVFDLGVKAGLGLTTVADDAPGVLQLAWKSGVPPPLPFRLPVYYRWEFTAGAAGDFESLVRRIVKRVSLPGVGQRRMDVSHAGPVALDMTGAVLGLEGALQPLGMTPYAWDTTLRARFETALAPLLDAGARAISSPTTAVPIVAPPLYGEAQTGQHAVPPATHTLAWMRTLNLDPRTRAAAAFGTAVVQKDQEALMASAWAQLAEVRRLNAVMRQAQLAREIAGIAHRERLSALSAPAALAVARPVLTRVGTADPSPAGIATLTMDASPGVRTTPVPTFHAWVAESAISAGAVSSAFQAVARPGGPVARRLFTPSEPVRAEVVKRLNARRIVAAPARGLPDKTVTIDEVTDRLVRDGGTKYVNVRLAAAVPGQFFDTMPGWFDDWQYHNAPVTADPLAPEPEAARMIRDDYYEPRPPRLPLRGTTLRAQLNRAFREAAVRHQQYLLNARTLVDPPASPPARDLDAMKKQLLITLDPERTFTRRVRGRVADAPSTLWQRPGDVLDPVLASPRYPQAMSEPLRELSPELILPGAEHVPPDTIAVLTANHRFIESYLVGLNHEMTRELIWRGYPGDVTGTCFRHFWPTTTAGSTPLPPECPNREDVKPIRDWRGQPLGKNACGASARSPLVLLLRTDLLRRYPSAAIFAVKAVNTAAGRVPGNVQEQPLFRGSIGRDITYFGFAITEAQAKGTGIGDDLGYYFVIQQHPTSPVFGLAATRTAGGPSRWRALSWEDLPAAATHVRMNVTVPTPASTDGLFWGQNAANMAAITQRVPVQIARHFSLILSA